MAPPDALGFDQCDNVNEEGEPIPWVDVGWAMAIFSIAEKYCGASPPSMRSVILRHMEVKGCGPQTPIFAEVEQALSQWEGADLKTIVTGGDTSNDLSPEQIREGAEGMAGQIGGCGNLLRVHRYWTNWGQLEPPEPRSNGEKE